MRLLDRYLLREVLIPLGYCLGGFLIFLITFDLFSELDRYQELHLRWQEIAGYYWARLPELLVLVLPVALLLALLVALTNHTRHHELVAIRAAGVSLWRLSLPYFAVGTVLSLVLLVLNERLVPRGEAAAAAVLARRQTPDPAGTNNWLRNLNLVNDRDRRLWNFGSYNLQTGEALRPHIDWRLADGTRRQLFAERGYRTNEGWIFFNVQEFIYLPGEEGMYVPSQTNVLVLPEFTETAEQIRSEIKIRQLDSLRTSKKAHLSVREILDYQRWHPGGRSQKSSLLRTLLHAHFAAPWTCLVVVVVALPCGLPSGRRNVFVGVASSIVIVFAYFVLRELSLALGAGGYLYPWLAAWLPNLLFAGGGLALIQRVR